MSGLVSELQKACLDSTIQTTGVLQKAYVVARKLGIREFENWLDKEIKGYKPNDDPPDYRFLSGEVKVWNPVRGWIPVVCEDPEVQRLISRRPTLQALGELEAITRSSSESDSTVAMTFAPEQERMLLGPNSLLANPRLYIATSALQGIIDKVRHIILTWSLDLEEKGIRGEGMTFSEHEKKAAESVQNIEIHYHGNVSQSQVGTHYSSQTANAGVNFDDVRAFVEEMQKNIEKLNLSPNQQSQVLAELETIESQLSAPKPSRGILGEALKSVRAIIEGLAGNLIAAAMLARMPHI